MPSVLSVVGHSGSGKTSLIERLVRALAARGRDVVVIKHHGHARSVDPPHKDTARVRAAGARVAVLASSVEVAAFHVPAQPPRLAALIAAYGAGADVVLCEGFHTEPGPKLEVWRRAVSAAPLCLEDPELIALVTDDVIEGAARRIAPDDLAALLALVGAAD
jgi:molybdopterin-guanine dinucleotide biosynthesis protein B